MSDAPKVETMFDARWRMQVAAWRDVQHRKWDGIPIKEIREAVDWEPAAAFMARGGLQTAERLADLLAAALVIIERLEEKRDD